ncbi:hypothetical protein [Paenibacillus polymyxa]|uniref:M1-362 n=1 Tax=Paenibacillus polymyxa (strain SC2) TaxID=886882 RepID=E3EC67_PAEPS|nr:hypothetical protein [Paenibacillus polymyxa]ADO54210.1 M1-362 [Paenibacillus polymyxa SC2]WPQ57133.1 hypothetical protein SKN87_01140 [Paenibacillus polymyxa]CCC83142.1 hypothetical protein PPM_0205 [Paenibacillus polymyxa M1]
MKYIHLMDEAQRLKILKKFKLPLGKPLQGYSQEEADELTEDDIFAFVYKQCEKYIPDRLIRLFENVDELASFKKGVKEHLIMNSYIVSNINILTGPEEKDTSNTRGIARIGKEIKRLGNELLPDMNNGNYVAHIVEEELVGVLQRYFDLEPYKRESSKAKGGFKDDVKVPYLVKPFIYFVTCINSIYKKLEKKEYSRELFGGISALFEEILKSYTEEQQIVSRYLFEREYSVRLINRINDNVELHGDQDIRELKKLFGFFAVLPNVDSRLEYLDVINKSLLNGSFTKSSSGKYGEHSYNEKIDNPSIWFDEVRLIILQFALVTLPLMELYHYELIYRYERSLTLTLRSEYDKQENIFETMKIVEGYKSTIDSDESYLLKNFVKQYPSKKRVIDSELAYDLVKRFHELDSNMDDFIAKIEQALLNTEK